MTASNSTVVTRFAPSPSGNLHVGGARTALFCYAFAKGRGGRFVLRIEDTDQKRSSDAASLGFLKDLDWFGLRWDEGPTFDAPDGTLVGGGAHGPYFQAQRLDLYDAAIETLLAEGKAYPAFDTAEDLDAARAAARAEGRPYRYDGSKAMAMTEIDREAARAEGRPCVIRFRSDARAVTIRDEILGEATLPAGEVDDFVIRKGDGFPTYHFAVVVDDELMGVTHVLRAQEHFNNTAKHLLLQEALGYRTPVYGHLPIIFNPDGSKMSKRDKDRTLREAVVARGIDAPPAGRDGRPLCDAETFGRWRGDKTVQLASDVCEAIAAALDVELPEINVEDFRRSGYLPEVLVNFLALNGWSPGHDLEKFDLAFLCERFASIAWSRRRPSSIGRSFSPSTSTPFRRWTARPSCGDCASTASDTTPDSSQGSTRRTSPCSPRRAIRARRRSTRSSAATASSSNPTTRSAGSAPSRSRRRFSRASRPDSICSPRRGRNSKASRKATGTLHRSKRG